MKIAVTLSNHIPVSYRQKASRIPNIANICFYPWNAMQTKMLSRQPELRFSSY